MPHKKHGILTDNIAFGAVFLSKYGASACRKSVFAPLCGFSNFQKSLKNLYY